MIKLYFPQLKRKPFEVKPTSRLVMKVIDKQLSEAKHKQEQEENPFEGMTNSEVGILLLENTQKELQERIDFVTEYLNLDDNLQKRLMELEPAEINDIALRISQRFLGMSDEAIDAINSEPDEGLAQ